MASIPFNLDESNQKASITKTYSTEVHGFRYNHYRLIHPNIKTPVEIQTTIIPSDKNYADVSILGYHSDSNKIGTSEMRHIARHITRDLGVEYVGGFRIGGARTNLNHNDPNKEIRVKIKEEHLDESNQKAELEKRKVTTFSGETGNYVSHHYDLYHPALPKIVKVIATIAPNDKKYADVNIIGNHSDYNKIGLGNVRRLKDQIKSDLNVDAVGGVRTGGARNKSGKGPSRAIIKESVEGLVIKKIHVHFDDDMLQHSYKIYHPNLKHPISVHATKYFKNPSLAKMNIGGNDVGKLGPAVVRHVMNHIKDDLEVSSFAGPRYGGARAGKNLTQYVKITEKVREPDEYDTQDLDEFSEHLRNKHGAHVDLYRTHDGHVNLQTIIVPKELRNQGIASAVVKDIKKYSNRNKLKIILNVNPLDDDTDENKLISFYKKHGFVENKGRNKDYSLAGALSRNHMYSIPTTRRGVQKSL